MPSDISIGSRWRMVTLLESLLPLVPARRVVILLGPVAVTMAALFLYLEATPGVLDRQERVRGRDFLNFYVLGRVLAEDGSQLYDANHFLTVQETVATVTDLRPRYYPMYPPVTALFFAPLAALPYETAILLWWLVQAACFALGFWWVIRTANPAPDWKTALLAALAAFYPVFSTFHNGQLAPVLLLTLWLGLDLHHRGWSFWAGFLLAGLTLKPQFAIGPVIWLLLRRDLAALTGFALSFALQSALVAFLVGPEVFLNFLENVRTYADMARRESTSPDHQHAFAGVLANLLGAEWADRSKLLHAGTALLAVRWLWQVTRHPQRAEGRRETVAVVLCTLAITPHLLTYDLILLLPALAWLWAPLQGQHPTERVGLAGALYLAAAAPPLYHFTGFSLVPLALLGGLFALGRKDECVA